MRERPSKRMETGRIRTGPRATETGSRYGVFVVLYNGASLHVISADGSDWQECGLPGEPWEHVSVSLKVRTPNWDELEFIKRQFWEDHETVMQLHVPRRSHINTNEFTLHLWRPTGHEIPVPPMKSV